MDTSLEYVWTGELLKDEHMADSPHSWQATRIVSSLLLLADSLSSPPTNARLSDSRMVGSALGNLGNADVPWQRVISASGAISLRGEGGAGATAQAERLRAGASLLALATAVCKERVCILSQS